MGSGPLGGIAFTKFRVTMTGQDASGDFSLWLASPGIELFGTLIENYKWVALCFDCSGCISDRSCSSC